jgi:hypothetical protein
MSAHHHTSSPASAESNQFIRPNVPSTSIDTASIAERLALKGAGLATSDEVVAATREGVAAELTDAVMAALSNRFERLSDEDVRIVADLYTAAPSAATTMANAVVEPEGLNILAESEHDPPHSPVEAGGDEAAGSPAPSIAAASEEKGAISSPEDDSSANESPSGDGPVVPSELPVVNSLSKWWTFGPWAKNKQGRGRCLTSLACRLTHMSLGQEPEVPKSRPVDIPKSLITNLARDPPKRIPGRRPIPPTRKKGSDESEDESNAPPPLQGPAPPPGGGDGDPPQGSGSDEEDEDDVSSDSKMEDAEEEDHEDPDNAGMAKFYKPQTPRGQAMAKMFRHFCDLRKQDANTIGVYFGVYSVTRLAAFQEDHWKDTFAQWQKRHPNRDSTEQAMVLTPPQ